MMKKVTIFAAIAMTMVGCSSDELVNSSTENTEAPIAFSVEKKNISRGTNLEAVNHFNFGVWAWKVNGKNSLADAEVMNNYLVGWSNGTDKGYNPNGATTFQKSAGTLKDHFSPWFYELLGTSEYKDGSFGYKTTDKDYMSNKDYQYLRYWDLAYNYTNFYCYAPYVNNDAANTKEVTFNHSTGEMSFAANTIRDGYDNTINTEYNKYDRSLSEFMYAGVKAENAQLKDVEVPFKHMGAQVGIQFYEDIDGYKVEIIDLGGDNGTFVTGTSDDMKKGIQGTPSEKSGDTYKKAEYYTTQGATVTFDSEANASYVADWTGSTSVKTPLMFAVPNSGLKEIEGLNGTKHQTIKERATSGTQEYSTSPTIYYAVSQPTDSKTGFTFHVSYRIIADDNKEMITVHNATVYVPAYDGNGKSIAAWQPNNKYTYTFKITKNSTGTTAPETPIDPTDETTRTTKGLYPIVFDGATIEDYEDGGVPETEISNGTTY